jgi:hypothetical protein
MEEPKPQAAHLAFARSTIYPHSHCRRWMFRYNPDPHSATVAPMAPVQRAFVRAPLVTDHMLTAGIMQMDCNCDAKHCF